jgi:hypothetical protein
LLRVSQIEYLSLLLENFALKGEAEKLTARVDEYLPGSETRGNRQKREIYIPM